MFVNFAQYGQKGRCHMAQANRRAAPPMYVRTRNRVGNWVMGILAFGLVALVLWVVFEAGRQSVSPPAPKPPIAEKEKEKEKAPAKEPAPAPTPKQTPKPEAKKEATTPQAEAKEGTFCKSLEQSDYGRIGKWHRIPGRQGLWC